jgi:transcriptional regulator with GAF, ATPase, and Fis domain
MVKQKLEDIETLVGDDFAVVLGKSKAISEVFDLVTCVAPTDGTILITGEIGTGKELIASALHLNSRQRDNQGSL